jgi:acyl carrier protein
LDKATLKNELKQLIIETLRLEDIKAEDISDQAPLFGNEGLGLDSVDALEIVVALEKKYGVIIADEEVGREALASLEVLADFIMAKKGAYQA